MATINVKDADDNTVAIEKPLVPGRALAVDSRPVVFSTEDKAALDLIAAVLGEVTADPTANTVLDRLKTIAAAINSISGYSDGLEALATTLNGLVDGLETLIGTTNTSLTTLQGYVDGLEGAFTTLNAKDFATQTTLAALLAKVIAAPATEAKQDSAITQETAIAAVAGTTAGAAVITDVNGTIQQYLRGLIKQWIAGTLVIGAGANLIGKVGVDQTTPGTTNAVVPNAVAAAGGISLTARLASAAASTNATNVKTSAGRIYSMQGYNAAAYAVYLVLYDSAANPPVPGTTTIRKKIPIPAGAAFALDWPVGLSFATGIGYAFTKLPADADVTALVAADVLQFNIDYA